MGEIGVALLLFVMGLETRPGRLWQSRGLVVGLGSLQYLLSAAAVTAFFSIISPSTGFRTSSAGWGWR